MLKLTQLAGHASATGAGIDLTPSPIFINDISDVGLVASAQTNVVTIAAIDAAITLRLTLTSALGLQRFVNVYRDGALISQHTSGTTIDVVIANNQTLQFVFTNSLELSDWSGTATLRNLSDANAVIASFAYQLTDTGSGGGGGGELP